MNGRPDRHPNSSDGRNSGANEVSHDRRDRAVETNDVERAGVVRIGNREPVGSHTDHDQLGADAHLLPVLAERLHRVNRAVPRLAVGVDHEHIDLRLVLVGPYTGQRAVMSAETVDWDITREAAEALVPPTRTADS